MWWCSWLSLGCGDPPQRPSTEDDVPVATLDEGEQVTIWCRKGSYYLIDYGLDNERLGWVVAGTEVRPLPSGSDGRQWPEPCTLFDEASPQ